MEPRIQYAKTKDGVSIAYYALGEGPAVLYMPPLPFRHIQRQWEVMPQDKQIAALLVARGRRLVQFDARGMGSSSRVEEFNLDGFVGDLEAVVDALDLEEFVLAAVNYSTPIAIAYAARYPERLSRLVLVSPFVRASKALDSPIGNALRAIRGQDWEVYTRSAMHVIHGWEQPELAQQMTAIMREAIRPGDLLKIMDAVEAFDVSGLPDCLSMPTLVVHSGSLIQIEDARAVAAGIPGAQFVAVRAGQELFAVSEFLGFLDAEAASRLAGQLHSDAAAQTGLTVILFADIAESTALTERLGDAAFRDKARERDGALRGIIREAGGTPIEGKLLGDGVLAVFTSARQGIEAALACSAAGSQGGLPLHVGLHAGDVIREEDNVYGGAVNIAARIADASTPGEVLVSQTVRDLARTSAGVSFEDRGQRRLKGIEERQRLFAVREGGAH